MQALEEYWIPLAISNLVAVLILLAAIKRTKLARLLLSLLFSWACWINYKTAHQNPQAYLDYASLTPFTIYRDFINGWFTEHVTEMVTLISIGQGSMALGFLFKGTWVRLACYGSILFFMAITPLGIGAGFPFTLIGIVAVWFILEKDDLDYIWMYKRQRSE